MPSRALVGIAGLLVLVGLGGGVWWLTGGGLDATRATDRDPTEAGGRRSGLEPSARSGSPATDASEDGRLDPAVASRGAAAREMDLDDPGLDLLVLDPEGVPVPGLPFTVFREAPRREVLLEAQTDAEGRAWLHPLPEGTVLVETHRRPPFARSLDAAWLTEGEIEERILRLRRGGAVRGRLVDELGQGIPGFGLFQTFRTAETAEREELGCTDAEGCFLVEALAPLPRGVWVVDEAPRPERLTPVQLVLDDGFFSLRRSLSPAEGATLDLGDLLVPRPPVRTGRVLDCDGRGLAGALVSTDRRFGFRALPATEPLPAEASPSQTFTDPEGRFELRDHSRGGASALVRAPDGREQLFHHPLPIVPGTTELLLRMREQCCLALSVRDADVDPLFQRLESPDYGALSLVAFGADPARAVARASTRLQPGETGAEVWFDLPPEALKEVRFEAWGFSPRKVVIPGPPRVVRSMEVTLPRIEGPSLSLRLRPSAPTAGPVGLRVHCCLAAPVDEEALRYPGCCGLGASGWVELRDRPVDLELRPLLADRFWVSVRRGNTLLSTHGPFATGEARHEIEVDLGEVPTPTPREPPEVLRPRGILEVRLGDDAGQPIAHASLTATQTATGSRRFGWGLSAVGDPQEGCYRVELPEGDYQLMFRCARHEPSAVQSVQIRSGEVTGLSVRVTPIQPVTLSGRLDLSEASGSGGELFLRHAGGGNRLRLDPDGRFDHEWYGAVDPQAAWRLGWVPRRTRGLPGEVQEVPVWWQFDAPPREIELPLPPLARVDVEIHGIPAAHRRARMDLWLLGPLAPENEALWLRTRDPLDAAGDGVRRLRLRAAPGTYRVEGRGVLYRIPARDLVVPPGTEAVQWRLDVQS